MVVDQNFLKVKRTLVTIFLFTLFINYSFADNLRFKKIVNLKGPWGSTFINDTKLLITEKSGEIKLIDINTNKILDKDIFRKNLGNLIDGYKEVATRLGLKLIR